MAEITKYTTVNGTVRLEAAPTRVVSGVLQYFLEWAEDEPDLLVGKDETSRVLTFDADTTDIELEAVYTAGRTITLTQPEGPETDLGGTLSVLFPPLPPLATGYAPGTTVCVLYTPPSGQDVWVDDWTGPDSVDAEDPNKAYIDIDPDTLTELTVSVTTTDTQPETVRAVILDVPVGADDVLVNGI